MYNHKHKATQQPFKALSICSLHLGPYRLIAHTTNPLHQAITPKPVNNHPLPIASISGLATIPPTQLKMFLMKLFTATPELLLLGMNSVNIVVDTLKITMEPSPKKKFATAGMAQWRWYLTAQPYQISAAG